MSTQDKDLDIFDPYDIDREEFNPSMYMLRYTRECKLSNIMLKTVHLDNQILNLNSQLQNLMYDNYRKFDKVTSVTANMKTNFQKMEVKMDDLYDNMNGIALTSSKILENLCPVEAKMTKLLRTQETIQKLRPLTDLATTLKMYFESGVYSAAARYYLKAEKVLKKYKDLPSLNDIVEDCTKIVAKIKLGLRNKLSSEMYDVDELSDTLNLLLALEEDPLILLKYFSDCRYKYLSNILASMDEIWSKDNSSYNEEHYTVKVNNYTNSCCVYIEKMSSALKVVKTVFQTQNYLRNKCITVWPENFFFENIDRLRDKLILDVKDKFHDVDDDLLSQALDKFVRMCHLTGVITTKINFYERGLNIALQICTVRCEIQLGKMKEDFDIFLTDQADEISSQTNIHDKVLIFIEWIEKKLASVLLSTMNYIRAELRCCREVTFRKTFCKVVAREGTFVEFLKYVAEQTWYVLTSSKKSPKPILCAALAKFLFDFADVASEILSKVDDYLCSTTADLNITSDKAITAEFHDKALKIIDLYIQIRCENMLGMIKKSMENRNWMTSKEPTRPRAVVKTILNDLLQAKSELEKIFGTGDIPRKKRNRNTTENSFLNKMCTIDGKPKLNISEEKVLRNRLFLKSSKATLKLDLNTTSIINYLVQNMLNSFIQLIRLETLNHFGLQQIQVDMYYFQSHASEWTAMEPVVQLLFDESVISAYNRTVNPQLMSQQVISVICSNVLAFL